MGRRVTESNFDDLQTKYSPSFRAILNNREDVKLHACALGQLSLGTTKTDHIR